MAVGNTQRESAKMASPAGPEGASQAGAQWAQGEQQMEWVDLVLLRAACRAIALGDG